MTGKEEINLKIAGLILVLAAQFGAIIWGAATVSSSVSQLRVEVSKVVVQQDKLSVKLQLLELGQVRLQTLLDRKAEQ